MRKFVFLFALSLSTALLRAQLPPGNPLFEKVLEENFDSTDLNLNKWTPFYSWGGGAANAFNSDTITGWCGSLQEVANILRDTNNRKISGGTCKLMAKKEVTAGTAWRFFPYPSPECSMYGLGPVPWDTVNLYCLKIDTLTFKYTNAIMSSKASFKYGYFETRFRYPGWNATLYNGFSPTFWLFNSHGAQMPWSEIDIYEIDGTNGKLTNNIHVDTQDDGIDGSHDPILGALPVLDLSQWHKVSANWTPEYIDFYIDEVFHRRSVKDTNSYLIDMNIIIESSTSATNFCLNVDHDSTQFPITYELDYVNVYQPCLACDTNKVYCNVSASTFKSKIYRSLTIGGNGCVASFNNGVATAEGSDFVLLNEGFEVGSNMNMLINTEPCWTDMKVNRSEAQTQIPFDQFVPYYKQIKSGQ